MRRFETSGEGNDRGEVISGWVLVESEQPLAGTATFGIRDAAGTVYTDVGVAQSYPGREFRMFADTRSWANTGIAVANPSEAEPAAVDVELYDAGGTTRLGGTTLSLEPLGHRALFLTELLRDVPSIDELEGALELESSLTWKWFLTGLPLVFSDPTAPHRGIFETLSHPEEEGGNRAQQYVVFVAAPRP